MRDPRVRDWSDERNPQQASTYFKLGKSILEITVLIGAVWVLLFVAQTALPYVQNGAAAVGQVKHGFALQPDLFGTSRPLRSMSFGNSKTLAGFQPLVFEKALNDQVKSFNLAIPGDDRFVDLIALALSQGNVPTHVLLQDLPRAEETVSLWSFITNNKLAINYFFPFRGYVRDVFIFLFDAKSPIRIVAQYRSNQEQIAKLIHNQGYYFIQSQSHYANDELPDDYKLPTDRPNELMKRQFDTSNPAFLRLVTLAETYNFHVFIIPAVFRVGEFASTGDYDDESIRLLRPYTRIHVLGPAYWLYKPNEFSDPVHLNPKGSAHYTEQLAKLLRSEMISGTRDAL